MASRQMKAFLDGMRSKPKEKDQGTIEQQRAELDDFISYLKVPENVDSVDFELAGRPARRFLPKGARSDRGVLYLHGGGYAVGSLNAFSSFMAHLAISCNSAVIGLDYRLAPEHPYPAGLEDRG